MLRASPLAEQSQELFPRALLINSHDLDQGLPKVERGVSPRRLRGKPDNSTGQNEAALFQPASDSAQKERAPWFSRSPYPPLTSPQEFFPESLQAPPILEPVSGYSHPSEQSQP